MKYLRNPTPVPWLLLAALLTPMGSGLEAQGQDETCVKVRASSIECDPAQPGRFFVVLEIGNSAAYPVDRLFLWPETPGIVITPDELLFAPVPPGGVSGDLLVTFDVPSPAVVGSQCLEVSIHNSKTGECCSRTKICPQLRCSGQLVRRGDSNIDGIVNIADAIKILNYLFLDGLSTSCLDVMDADDTGALNITDAVYLLTFLFLGGRPVPPPGIRDCGLDPTPDNLPCQAYPPCA